jgi:hypothetical protein
MELAESIKTAWAAVEDSGVPENMQELAFREALRSLLGTTQPVSTAGRGSGASASAFLDGGSGSGSTWKDTDADGADGADTVDEQAVIAAVSEHTGVPADRLEQVFHIDNGAVKVSVNHNALGKNSADKARAAAQIITVVRKIGMGHNDTDFDIIRDECQRKHIYDGKNFASAHMPGIDGFVVKGEGRNKRLEARTTGVNAFPSVIDKVLGDS